MTVGVIRFLGTNCDSDVFEAAQAAGLDPQWVWYQDQFQPSDYQALFLPGGFSYGDYLRSGALAARAPVMKSVKEAAQKGVPVLGICNGFQILCEAGLLPGVLVQNSHLRFRDEWVDLEIAGSSAFGPERSQAKVAPEKNKNQQDEVAPSLRLPIAHGDGRYIVTEDELHRLQDADQIWIRYKKNPNGSVDNIAGVTNKNVAGLMPHPERAFADWMGGNDGRAFFTSLL